MRVASRPISHVTRTDESLLFRLRSSHQSSRGFAEKVVTVNLYAKTRSQYSTIHADLFNFFFIICTECRTFYVSHKKYVNNHKKPKKLTQPHSKQKSLNLVHFKKCFSFDRGFPGFWFTPALLMGALELSDTRVQSSGQEKLSPVCLFGSNLPSSMFGWIGGLL